MIKLESFATWMSEKVAPKLLQMTENTASPLTKMVAGATVGGAVGSVAGVASSDQQHKRRGILVGALAGAALGGFGGKTLANFGKGGTEAGRIKGLAETMKNMATNEVSTKDYIRGLTRHIADWGTPNSMAKVVSQENVNGKQVRPLFGFLKQSPIGVVPEHQKFTMTHTLGNLAQTGLGIGEGGYGLTSKSVVGRTTEALKNEFTNSQYFSRNGLRYKRSLMGKGLAAVGTTGLGMGALEMSTAQKKNGKPEPMPEKIVKGTTTAIGWGLAPQVMGAKAIAYDIPRQAINPNRGN
jgi:hypothetical protein